MRTGILALCLLLAVGCGSPKPVDDGKGETVQNAAKARVNAPAKVEPPDFQKTRMRMVRKGEEVRVGDSVDDALRIFKEAKNASKLSEMPPGWKDEAFKSAGWDAGTEGFGVIAYNDHVALALYHEDRINEDRLREILDDYDNTLEAPSTPVTGSRVRYWFWEDGPHRLMISAVQNPTEGLSVSIALGDNKLMDLFRMSKAAAENDRQTAENLFRQGLEAKRAEGKKP